MCQGCEDYGEFERVADAILSAELKMLMAQPIDTHALTGY